ncbi:MAG TPA: hypothetical protein VFL14_11480 [Xanthomonadales bacterium]|nr:hypothetical protein [Xanthomonadales bacterium]
MMRTTPAAAPTRDAALALAQAAFGEFRLFDAERLLRKVLADDPGDVGSLHQLGIVLQRQLRYRESLAALLEAAERSGWQRSPLLDDLAYSLAALRGFCARCGDTRQLSRLAHDALAANDVSPSLAADGRGTVVVVLGMHRSGTSALTRMLALAGAALPRRLLVPQTENPRGFWESIDVLALNERLLHALGGSWSNPPAHEAIPRGERAAFERDLAVYLRNEFGGRRTGVLKDPRMSLFAATWRRAILACGYRPVFVVPVRHPLEVARSLAARDEMPLLEGLALWDAYMSRIVQFAAGATDVVFLRSGDLLRDWRAALQRIDAALDLALDLDAAAAEAAEFLDPALHRQRAGDEDWRALAGNAIADAARARHEALLARCG